ncbi:TFIIH basal transcription factor complex, subunit SSL1 [Lepidopterella palustris CBS 459.81]|uniref:General transcription and DNA repair factor IIH n=1 Tax=Lepidopterella palustris CBS 459.81 TaxID=1314670 RepID=A0A8E2JCB3_9PEZI|nr:TFIIH basal transcription factor complex, subunit SSL1 [Lepidopterella palustris CBS 459.81]
MADSDGEYVQDASDDEYLGGINSYGTRTQGKGKVRARENARPQQAWESAIRTGLDTFKEAADGTIQQSVQEREEERKRKRLRKDARPFQRGIIRHVVLVLDLSEAMLEKDMRPNRYITIIKYTQEYVREFFEQNPISQMSVMAMHDGLCLRVSELSGNPTDHIGAIQGLRFPKNPRDVPKEPKGSPSLQNALELARATLYHTPSHGTREVIIILGALLSLDPGDIHATIKSCVRDRLHVNVIGMGGRLRICQEIVGRTNAGDESGYVVATDQESLRDLLLATTTPPVIRSTAAETFSGEMETTATPAESAASLLMMGFPSRIIDNVPTLCACHGNLTRGGYTCPRCSVKICSLPATCPGCHLTVILSTHLARSYHHLFPLRLWKAVSWHKAKKKGSRECVGCLSLFPDPPAEETEASNGIIADDASDSEVDDKAEEEVGQQKASESSRYQCRSCKSHFCIDCDLFCHEVLHNCPGCLSQANSSAAVVQDVNTDVAMIG